MRKRDMGYHACKGGVPSPAAPSSPSCEDQGSLTLGVSRVRRSRVVAARAGGESFNGSMKR